MKCNRCGASHSGEALFCANCGERVREDEGVECETHSTVAATGVCVVCGKPVCDDCAVTRDARVFCEERRHADLASTHERVSYVPSESEGEMVVKNLASGGIPALLFSMKPYSHFCRLTDEGRMSVFVPLGEGEKARRLLEEMDLTEFLSRDHE